MIKDFLLFYSGTVLSYGINYHKSLRLGGLFNMPESKKALPIIYFKLIQESLLWPFYFFND
jgi:hypothetical protein